MITKVVFANNYEITKIGEIEEYAGSGDSFSKSVMIIRTKLSGSGSDVGEIERALMEKGRLSEIKIYKKDEINRVFDDVLQDYNVTYGPEYLSATFTKYLNVSSIHKNIDSGTISISLSQDRTQIADEKYNELILKNEELEKTILELTITIGAGISV